MTLFLFSSFMIQEVVFENLPIPAYKCQKYAFDVLQDMLYVACYRDDTLSVLWTENGGDSWSRDVLSIVDTVLGLKVVLHPNSRHVIALVQGETLKIFYRDYDDSEWKISQFEAEFDCYLCGVWEINKPRMEYIHLLPLDNRVALAYERVWTYSMDTCGVACGSVLCGDPMHATIVIAGSLHAFIRYYGDTIWQSGRMIPMCGAINNYEEAGWFYNLLGLSSDNGKPYAVVYEWFKNQTFYALYLPPGGLVYLSYNPAVYYTISRSFVYQSAVSKTTWDTLYFLDYADRGVLAIAYVHGFHLDGRFLNMPFGDNHMNFAILMDSLIVLSNGYQYAYSFDGFNNKFISDTIGMKVKMSWYRDKAYLMWLDEDTTLNLGVVYYKAHENKTVLSQNDLNIGYVYDVSGRKVDHINRKGVYFVKHKGKWIKVLKY